MPTSPLPITATSLPNGGLRALLRDMGASDEFGNPPVPYTGRLVLEDNGNGRDGAIFMRAGKVYATHLSGYVPPVATRMLSGGLIASDVFDYLNSLDPAEVGPAVIENNYATADDVEDVHRQIIMSTLTHLYGWTGATWRWEEGVDTDAYTISGLDTSLLVTAADERIGQWDALTRNFLSTTKSNSVPQPGPMWAAKTGQVTTPEIASILTHVHSKQTIAQIATECGFTRFEIAARLAKAVADGILIIPDPDGTPVVDAREDSLYLPEGVDAVQYELDEAIAVLEEARGALAAAEARVARAQTAANMSARRPIRPAGH